MKPTRVDDLPRNTYHTLGTVLQAGIYSYSALESEADAFRLMLSKILNMFLHSHDPSMVENALSVVMNHWGADRIYLRLFGPEGYSDRGYQVVREGAPESFFIAETAKESQENYREETAWLINAMSQDQLLVVENIEEAPQGLDPFLRLMKAYGCYSSLVMPTYNQDQINGFIAMDYADRPHSWSLSDIYNLKIIAVMFSNAIEKSRISREYEIKALLSLQNDVLLNIVFDNLQVGLELYDEKGYLTRINPAGLDILGAKAEELFGVNLFDNPTISEKTKERLRGGEEARFENSYNFKEITEQGYLKSSTNTDTKSLFGYCSPLKDNQGNVFGYLLMIQDNTEFHRREVALESNLTKLRLALDTGQALIWGYDVEKGKFEFDRSLTGTISSWIVEQSQNSEMLTVEGQMGVLHPDDTERFYSQAVLPMFSGETDQVSISYRQLIDGKYEWMNSNFRSLRLPGKSKPSKIFCYTNIITEQREMELELIKMRETDRLKTLFMENLSHEIRTPLNAIVGFSNVLSDMHRCEENEEIIHLIEDNNNVLLKIVDNMLNLSKLESEGFDYELQRHSLSQMCRELYNRFVTQTAEGVALSYNEMSPETFIYSDKKRLFYVLSNIIENAIKFTAKGSISLHYSQSDDGKVEIVVSDTGIGMSEEEMKHLFLPFYKVNIFQQGIGLGLHIAKKIVHDLGGTIHVESEKGLGTTLRLCFPINKEEPA